jgi:RNA polymerase sigma-70 factor (ECF subfamily)
MHTTPVSLLERLRTPGQQADWDRFVFLYTPLLCCWARRLGLQGADVEDVVQDVLAVVVEKIAAFDYDPQRRFRGWLWTVLANKVRAGRRRMGVVVIDDRAASTVTQEDDFAIAMEESEYRQYLVQRILPLLEPEFQRQTWQVFEACAVKGQAPSDVAVAFNMTLPAVYAAKSRVLRRVRAELADLID